MSRTSPGEQDTALPTLAGTDLSSYDFIDFGGSKGGSVRFCEKAFLARGIGVDLDPKKVKQAREKGVDAVLGDATDVDLEDAVRFVSMMDFLEHLPSLEHVESAISVAARAATDFLFISHPSFEAEDYVGSLGFKQYWWDWHGHPSHITIADYRAIFERLGLSAYIIRFREQVEHSGHPSVLPADAPEDSGSYERKTHGPKAFVPFAQPVWRSQRIYVALRPLSEPAWTQILAR